MLLEHAKSLWYLAIHKYSKPRYFKHTKMEFLSVPVHLLFLKKCMDADLEKWFTKQFYPAVKYLATQRQPQKVSLLVDNASCNSDCQFSSPDKHFDKILTSKHN